MDAEQTKMNREQQQAEEAERAFEEAITSASREELVVVAETCTPRERAVLDAMPGKEAIMLAINLILDETMCSPPEEDEYAVEMKRLHAAMTSGEDG